MRARASQLIGCFILALAGLPAAEQLAHAEPSYAGTWQAGATTMEVAIQSWGQDCGPRPQSTQAQGGGSVQVEQRGQVLTIRGGGREVRSDRCWSPNPSMRRAGSSYASGLWTTRCKTAASDPRQEAGTYTLKALSPDRILYQDVSHFDWRLKDSTCVATITTTQTLLRQGATSGPSPTAAAPSGAAPKPGTAKAGPSCVPGTPARIALRPRDAKLELGDRLCFHARVVDAKGCPIEGAPVQYTLTHAPAIKADMQQNGCFVAGQSSAEAEGTFTVVATQAKLRAEATVEVAALTLPALLAKRMEMGAVGGEEDEPEPAAEEATVPVTVTRVAAKAVAEPRPVDRRPQLLAVCALLVLAVGGVLLYRARSQPRTRSRPSPTIEPPAQRIRRCPTCGSSYPETSAFCGVDGSALRDPE